jgi:iron complex transport system substrate-binding protein
MRIVSLLPSLTELVCAIGRSGDLVGVTHECDYPPGVENLPHLTRSRISGAASSDQIDRLVTEQAGSLYELDEDLLADLRPDLILTQKQCDVCAVNETTVRQAAQCLAGRPTVESVNPMTLADVFVMFRRIGAYLHAVERATDLVARFVRTTKEIADRHRAAHSSASPSAPRRVLLLEWLDPPFSSGHWNPEIIRLAGGFESLGRSGQKSSRIKWDDVTSSQSDLILVAPCGFSLDRTATNLATLNDRPEWRDLAAVRKGAVVIVDGSAYFSRPGPRLEASLRIAAAAIDPESCIDLAPPEGQGWRFWPVTT